MRVTAVWRAMATAGLVMAAQSLPGSIAADELTPVRAFRAFNRTTAPDLPESIVVDLLQDRDGVLWIDTLGGLATYDGTEVRAVRDPEAPRGASLLAERQAGGVYAVSRRGLHVYDGRWRRVATSQPIGSVTEVGGWLWALVGDTVGRTAVDAVGATWERVELPAAAGAPRGVASDRNGGVYVFGTRQVLRCRDDACAPTPLSGHRPPRVTTALAARDGTLWIGTWDGRLLAARPGAPDWDPVELGPWPSGGVRSLAEDRDGRIWAGGMARLCSGVSGAAWTCWGPENGLPSSAILSLLADREGTLWLGLNGAGLLQWVGQPWTHRTRWPGEPLAQSLDVISVAATRDGGVLASVFGRGILRWDGSRLATWGRADGLEEDVRAVVEPAPGSVWAGARHGVFEKDRRGRFRRALALSNGFASGFARDPQGTWHVFTDAHGIFRRDARWQPAAELNALVPGTLVRAMQWTDDGDLWIAAARELVVRRRSGVVERHPLGLERGLPDTISSLLVVGPDEIWAGGQGGLAIGERGEWRLLTQAEGVPGNVYFLRRAPDGTTWVGGSRGIARVRSGRWTTWDRTSGLVGDECNGGAILLADGTLLAATAGSLARFDPSVPSRPAAPLQVRWREPADARDASVIRRPADQRRVVLGWSAPWLGPHPVEYSTRIADGAWSAPTRSTQVAVENLPAGRSDVAVRARRVGLAGDDWSAPLALGVEVAPRLAETTGARVAVTLAVVALLLLGAHLAARRAHARREQALARMRTDFMGSASHELRTPIAQIRLFADMLRLGRARNEGERAEALQTIHRATVRLEALAGNLMRLARGEARVPVSLPQRVDVAALVREAAQDVSALAAARGAELQVEAEPGLQGVVDVEGVRVVLSNLLENALKYGPAGQVVRLGAEQTADGLRVFVEDEGPGIPPADREHVWERFARLDRDRNSSIGGTGLGLAVVRETVAQAGGEAHIEDVEPSGTRVVVLLPQPDGEPPAVGPAASREVMP